MPILIPLITPLSRKYFMTASNDNAPYYKAIDLRLCLEKLANTMIYEFLSDKQKADFEKLTLHKKILMAKEFMPDHIVDNLIKSKDIGNKGAHEGEEANLSKKDINDALQYITDFSLSLFVEMLKKYGLTQPGGSWIAPVFSTLPPIYRIKILNEYIEFDQSPIVIEKLSMAYLKNNMEYQAFNTLDKYYELGAIDNYFYQCMIEKLNILKPNLNRFPIAQNLQMAKENFNNLLTAIPEKERDNFVFLMSLILNENTI